jgi:hypothetical protein
VTVVTSPYEVASAALKQIFDAEFATEMLQLQHDQVHESLGIERAVAGIAPSYDTPQPRDMNVQETWVEIRFFDQWSPKVDPKQSVDPRIITNKAERLRQAIGRSRVTAQGELWFLDVMRCTYPDDPTGNKSRFVMQVRCFGNNSGLVETVG